MNKYNFILLTFLLTYISTIQGAIREGCQPVCPDTIAANPSSTTEQVSLAGTCSAGCSEDQPCTGSVSCLYNTRTGMIQGASSSCRCGAVRTPVPSQLVRSLTRDLAQKMHVDDEVWDKRYLKDAVNDRTVRMPVPSQVVRTLTRDLAQKMHVDDETWNKRYLKDTVNDRMDALE